MFSKSLKSALVACIAGCGLFLAATAKADPPVEKPPHIVESLDMKGRMDSGLPCASVEEPAVIVKTFFAKMRTYPDMRFREFFDPRYLEKHGLADKSIAFEAFDYAGIENLQIADDRLTAFVVLRLHDSSQEAFIMRCVVLDKHIYISPEKAPDASTGIITPWILRTKVK